MKYIIISLIIFAFSFNGQSQDVAGKAAIKMLDENRAEFKDIALKIWDYAELGYLEEKSSALLKSMLKENGFKIESGVGGMPTAFIASYGSGQPVIAILGEFDALPGVSQTNDPIRKKRPETNSGHACGHHLFGTASMAASIAIRRSETTIGLQTLIKILIEHQDSEV